jgi:hypothetical protein
VSNRVLIALCALLFVSTAVFGATGQSSTAGASTTSSSTVTVTIPSVIGIDVETDVAINLASYLTNTNATTGACPANVFPPPAGCTGAALFTPTASTTTAGAPTPTPTAGNIWMSVFCNRSAGTLVLSAQVAAAWTPVAGPGFGTTSLRVARSGANNAVNAGFATLTNLTTAATPIGSGTLPATFNWTRVDQQVDLAVPSASTVTYAAGSYAADVTFTIAK